jgi:Sigma-70 region 2
LNEVVIKKQNTNKQQVVDRFFPPIRGALQEGEAVRNQVGLFPHWCKGWFGELCFAHLETPARFVRAYVLRTLAQWEMAPSPDLVEDLTQEGLLACWQRRHAPHIQNFPRYYAAMLRGLVTQHCKRLLREQAQLVPLQNHTGGVA